ncbi:MAG: TonB-dependent receptor plug domain-containing protein, partial [Pseudomonadales bacterium]|nr:TonB-dependent receptor plug domain-containing protein [Pseudomonadales bacterium]
MGRHYRTRHKGMSAPRFALNCFTLGLLSANTALAAETELPALTVTGEDTSGYQADSASVSGFDAAPLLDTPASISVFNDALIKDQQARLLSEVLRNDASVGQSYAPVGYYENFVVRGFSLNAAS